MSTRITNNVGDVVECGTAFRVDGTLTTPTTAIAYVQAPDGTLYNSTDNPTRVALELEATTLSALVGDRMTPKLTAAERAAGVGIVRVRFVANDHGGWGVVVHGTGAAQGTDEFEVSVRRPVAAYRFAGSTTVS